MVAAGFHAFLRVAEQRLSGRFWHVGPSSQAPLWVPEQPPSDGRYHRRGGPAAWYASDAADAAWSERDGVDPSEERRRVTAVDVEDLPVLDLTDPGVRAVLGVSEDDLICEEYTLCQQIAEGARRAGFEGVLAPSAAVPRRKTLVVFGSGMTTVQVASTELHQRT